MLQDVSNVVCFDVLLDDGIQDAVHPRFAYKVSYCSI